MNTKDNGMRFVPCDISEIEAIETDRRRAIENSAKISKLINDFVESGLQCSEVVDYSYKNPYSCCVSLRNTIKYNHIHTVSVVKRGRRIFLVRKEI